MKIKKLRKLFHYFNKELFDNSLELCDIKVTKWLGDCYGMFIPWDSCEYFKLNGPKIYLNPEFNLTFNDYYDTLLHEMIHLWQWKNNKPLDHSDHFLYWCDIVESKLNYRLVGY